MVGSAVATMVWSSAAINRPNTIARKIRLRRCGLTGSGRTSFATCVASVILAFPSRSELTGPRRYADDGGRETHCAAYSASPSLSISSS